MSETILNIYIAEDGSVTFTWMDWQDLGRFLASCPQDAVFLGKLPAVAGEGGATGHYLVEGRCLVPSFSGWQMPRPTAVRLPVGYDNS